MEDFRSLSDKELQDKIQKDEESSMLYSRCDNFWQNSIVHLEGQKKHVILQIETVENFRVL